MQSSLNFDSTQSNTLSTSAEPDAMDYAVAECGPSERAVQDKSVSPQQGSVTAQALPTATAEGSPISQKTSARGLGDGAASSLEIRLTKKALIHQFFAANLGRKFSTYEMHGKFGTAFRSRVSELNRDADLRISILNETKTIEGQEHSYYWSALR